MLPAWPASSVAIIGTVIRTGLSGIHEGKAAADGGGCRPVLIRAAAAVPRTSQGVGSAGAWMPCRPHRHWAAEWEAKPAYGPCSASPAANENLRCTIGEG